MFTCSIWNCSINAGTLQKFGFKSQERIAKQKSEYIMKSLWIKQYCSCSFWTSCRFSSIMMIFNTTKFMSVSYIRLSFYTILSSFEGRKPSEVFFCVHVCSLCVQRGSRLAKGVFLWDWMAADLTGGTEIHCFCKALSWVLSGLLSNTVCVHHRAIKGQIECVSFVSASAC